MEAWCDGVCQGKENEMTMNGKRKTEPKFLVNRRSGSLTIMGFSQRDSQGHYWWWAVCDCRTTLFFRVRQDHFLGGHVISCGCRERSRRNSAHKPTVRQSTEAAPAKNAELERQIKPREQTSATVISVPSAPMGTPRKRCFAERSVLGMSNSEIEKLLEGKPRSEQCKILSDIADAWLVPVDSLRLPPGHKCAHGVYIPANSRYQERARYCSICHPYPILRCEFVWCSPNGATVNNIRYSGPPFPPFPVPHWTGERRPHGARRVRLQSRFPDIRSLTHLVEKLGYDGRAAFAVTVQAHQPSLRTVDRRRANPIDVDAVVTKFGPGNEFSAVMSPLHQPRLPKFNWPESSKLVSERFYCPASPGRRTKTGGGWTKQQVQHALNKKRWDSKMKRAVFEIVYRRRMTQEVSEESGLPVSTLYVYASRLRQDMHKIVKDLAKGEKARA
jgi:hypothetical protein